MNINLTLGLNEVNAILHALGQLPTNTGVFPLLVEIKKQSEAQIPEDMKNKISDTESADTESADTVSQ